MHFKIIQKLQDSYSTVSERIVEIEMPENNDEFVLALKRRNERAESRISDLENQISDEAEIVHTLKRKVQEETMVHKFKERRLDYTQRKDTGKCVKGLTFLLFLLLLWIIFAVYVSKRNDTNILSMHVI